jgi:hypothetical protein
MKINQCCLKSLDRNLEKREEIALARKEFLLAMLLLGLLLFTGEMIYVDCIERGVC